MVTCKASRLDGKGASDMNLGLNTLSNDQLYELLQETLITITNRGMDYYFTEACQLLIHNQAENIKTAKEAFDAYVMDERTKQLQALVDTVRLEFNKWKTVRQFISNDEKKKIMEDEYDKLASGERAIQVSKIQQEVKSNIHKILKPEDYLNAAEELIIATDCARKILEVGRKEAELREARRAALEAARFRPNTSNSSRDVVFRLSKCLGVPEDLMMIFQVDANSVVVGAVIERLYCNSNPVLMEQFRLNGEPIVLYKPTGSPNTVLQVINPISNLDGSTPWKVVGKAKAIRVLIEEYIINCGDIDKLNEVIPAYDKMSDTLGDLWFNRQAAHESEFDAKFTYTDAFGIEQTVTAKATSKVTKLGTKPFDPDDVPF